MTIFAEAHILHTSEACLSGYAGSDVHTFANFDWPRLRAETTRLRELAASLNLWLVLGSAHFLDDQTKPTNCLYLINPQGEIVDRYDKSAKRYLTAPPASLYDHSWHCLAVAAVRSAKWKDALKLIQKTEKEGLYPAANQFRQELESVARQAHPRLAWMPPVYPGIDFLLHEHVMKEWEALLTNVSDPPSPSQKRKISTFIQKYPFFFFAMKRLLYEQETCPSALASLAKIDNPEADAEILKFALSQVGAREARVQAILALMQTGRYTGSKVVRIWFEDQDEWRELELNTQRIGDIELNARPKTLVLIEKARLAKDPQAGIALLRKAVEIEPTSPIALFNLGVVLVKNGRVEEGNALIQKSVIVDPNYTFGHASIALSEADKGNDHEAINHLDFVSRAEVIAPQTALIANLARVSISLNKMDLKAARDYYELAAQILPGNPILAEFEEMLKDTEAFAQNNAFIIDFQRQSARRSHQKLLKTPLANEMSLEQCLEINSKEMLVGTAHYLQISSSGKKGELVSRLAKNLLDEEFLYLTLPRDLAAHEHEALKWLLEAGGVCPWKDFIRRYGDDMEESVLWNYHEPQSIPGRLRMCGLLFSGTLDDQQVAFIPAGLRPLLQKTL